ncbi:mitochondrial membrane fission protein [Mitosporidium daphniae]|uniref:Mitochondrial fission 1 protein n=1 Tax=Mitosporidium daphniae TaxID=1485682 RepID=A0A098VZ30_9MICR|nr:mitochondrial membrane fission protein [Mitosporidium daphniae]KGG52986.1 mitochondrial membrane fission protein [Mitosporidium daphniae]|eukprot:XP_013239413.1 mitochondrial membrane fission protein [Mitosporidium daphniae]
MPSFSSIGSILESCDSDGDSNSSYISFAPEINALEISIEELRALELVYEKETRDGKNGPTDDVTFSYAWGLTRKLLERSPDRKRDCLYYLAIAYYRQDDLVAARKCVNDLLAFEPTNEQALAVQRLIKKKISRGSWMSLSFV